MDNWITFLLVNVALALVVSVFGNFATPWVKSAYDRSIFSSRQRRTKATIKEFNETKDRRDDISKLLAFTFHNVVLILTYSSMMLSVLGGYTLLGNTVAVDVAKATVRPILLVTVFYLAMIAFPALRTLLFLDKIMYFDRYKERIIKKLIKLGGNPEDLDKEEAVG